MKKWFLISAALLAFLTAVFVLSLPCAVRCVLPRIDFAEYTIPLSTNLTAKLEALTGDGKITVRPQFGRDSAGMMVINATGRIAGAPYTLSARLSSSYWFLRGTGRVTFALDSTPWRIDSSFAYEGKNWNAKADLAKTEFSGLDPLLAPVIARKLPPAVSNLVFSGALSFSAEAARTRELPVVAFSARGRLEGLDASCDIGNRHFALNSFSTGFGADGIANRVTISPMFARAESAEAAGFTLAKPYVSVRKTETAFLVTEAGTGICGGEAKLYSLFLDPKKLMAGCTLYLDSIDAGEAISHLAAFKGTASGRLHGRVPLSLRNGNEIRLGRAYLYSNPGEGGELQLQDPETALETLAAGGVNADTLDNLSSALKNLKYDILKLDLERADEEMVLKVELHGSATKGKTTVPVDLTLNLRGDLEEIINTGIKASNLKKKGIRL